jgi:hypothetical protein
MEESKYDNYGNLIGKQLDDIKKGDLVQYHNIKRVNGKTVKTSIVGIWDGEKVCFDDPEKTVVRTIHWLIKIKECPLCRHELK